MVLNDDNVENYVNLDMTEIDLNAPIDDDLSIEIKTAIKKKLDFR